MPPKPTASGSLDHQYEQWLAYDVVFRHKTPITAVRRVVSVVALHPIVVEFEGVRRRRLVVNVNLSLLYFEFVALVNLDATLVNRQVIQCQRNALALCRNPYRAVVVARPYFPAKVGIARMFEPEYISLSVTGRIAFTMPRCFNAATARLVSGI